MTSEFDFSDESRPGSSPVYGRSDTSRVLYVILALVFGGLGVHNFAAGRYVRGGLQFATVCASPFTLFLLLIPLALWLLLDIVCVTTDGRGRRFN